MNASRHRVWVTRDETDDGPLSRAIRGHGFDVETAPLLRTEQLSDGEAALRSLSPGDWLVLTSPQALRSVSALAISLGLRTAVVGEASRRIAEARGFRVALTAPEASAKDLWNSLRPLVQGQRVCFLKSEHAPLPESPLQDFISETIYRMVPVMVDPAVVTRCTVVAFTSPTAVTACLGQFGGVPLPAACIGATTESCATHLGANILCVPRIPSLNALASEISTAIRDLESS
ncbi:MAG: uroporphyrinogen-III synthase [Planctomycetota bacterium]